MAEREQPDFFYDERFTTLQVVQAELERRGYYLYPVEKEHAEALVISPLLHKLRTRIKKRGFGNVAGRIAITFSGYAHDERELYAIPEARAYWRELDAQLPELPALVATQPEFHYNGPGMHVTLLGHIDTVVHRPAIGGYDLHVVNGPAITDDAVRRIRQAGRRYHLSDTMVAKLVDHFRRGANDRW